jgi:hypothetical protein
VAGLRFPDEECRHVRHRRTPISCAAWSGHDEPAQEQREIFIAHRVHDMSYGEIAERTGLTVRQVERTWPGDLQAREADGRRRAQLVGALVLSARSAALASAAPTS